MDILRIANLGHPILRAQARPLSPDEIPSEAMQRFIDCMIETMRYHEGIGLAAPQVHKPLALIVYRDPEGQDEHGPESPARVLINPRLKPIGAVIEEGWEGCLSLKDLRGLVPRSREVWVSGLDRCGIDVEMRASGLSARVLQHECDHLEGIIFLDRMKNLQNLGFAGEVSKFSEKGD